MTPWYSTDAKQRYADKIQLCGSIDPYSLTVSPTEVPINVSYADIYHFMVVETNPFTGYPKDCRKGMEANLWFQQGWIKYVGGKQVHNVFVVHGRVLHSFNLRKTPLKPWIIVDRSGKILSAHCNCTIGLLETCSHVGATLFALEDIRRKIAEKKFSVTDLPAYWNKPPRVPEQNLYKKMKDISFGRKVRRF
ncbi:uncharacterized protein LOC134227827 [Armigeres subalbatus]|uniref:uncharacterized protein LOC134227827 n=1 Tax=Armigeres subalbatus TaxID=124917 RepID=UPI002ED0DE68